MARFSTKGLDEYIAKLEKLTSLSDTREFVGRAIFEGAAAVKPALLSELNDLQVAQVYAKPGQKINTITSVQKAGLLDGFGIAKMRKDGNAYNVKLGFAGYNGQKTKKYPNGQPNALIARSIVSGTSFRAKNDFVRRAVNASKAQALDAMKKEFEDEIKKAMS